MKVSTVLCYIALGATSARALPTENVNDVIIDDVEESSEVGVGIEARTELPGLNAGQTKYAHMIVQQAKKDNVGSLGCQAAITAALAESNLMMTANSGVQESMKLRHDRVTKSRDAMGLFKIRKSEHGDVKCNMNATCSAGIFFKAMKAIKDWQKLTVVHLAPRVLRAARPETYRHHVDKATKVCKAAGM